MTPIDNSLSVVIPVYNSECILDELIEKLVQSIPKISSDYEIILVNDGSRDQSWQVISRLCNEDSSIKGINLMRNYGQHNALLCGIRAARNEITVTMDDDLQHPPEEIHNLIEKLQGNYDVVYGTPRKESRDFWRKLASQITRLALQSAMGVNNARNVSAFRAFRTSIRESFVNYQSPFVIIDVLLTWGTTKFTSTQVRHDERISGRSQYTFRKLIVHAINMMTGFTVLPLQIASMMGFLFAVFGLIVLIYVIGRFFIEGGSVPGFPFLASTIAIFSGVQLFALGIIGEYLARMHFRLMERPSYIIKNEVGVHNEPIEN
jgi:undecaprenyl-phosphate 4-deoxy-4-formamido-L-arabinose transferase